MYPKKDTVTFKIMECLFHHGEMTVDQVIEKIGYVTSQSKRSVMLSMMKNMSNRYYVINNRDYFYLTSELKAYVEDVLEMSGSLKKENVVGPAYKRPFGPEMKNYNLFANKRGY